MNGVNPFSFVKIAGETLESAQKNLSDNFNIQLSDIELWAREKLNERRKAFAPCLFPCGKYEGKDIDFVMEVDPQYVFWATKKMTKGGKKFLETLSNYKEVAKEKITQSNSLLQNALLPIEDKATEKTLTICSVFYREENQDFVTKFCDVLGNRYKYTGKKISENGEEVTLKMKVKYQNTYMGINTNILAFR
jgi:hypothetical protein